MREAELTAEVRGEAVVLDLGFLQAQHVGPDLRYDPAQTGLPQPDRVGVPSSDPQAQHRLPRMRPATWRGSGENARAPADSHPGTMAGNSGCRSSSRVGASAEPFAA